MSEVPLAPRYAAKNYPIALKNLSKRCQKKDEGEEVHYSELAFGELSEEQAKVALRFFSQAGLIENTTGANYIPPKEVVTWQIKIGEQSDAAKKEVRELLNEYDVFSEMMFVLNEGEMDLSELAEQVGGMVGIDEDEVSKMEKTIEVFSEMEFVEVNEDGTVSSIENTESEKAESTKIDGQESDAGNGDSLSVGGAELDKPDASGTTHDSRNDDGSKNEAPQDLTVNLDVSINATEMDPDDLEEKLEVIRQSIGHDGE